MALTQLRFDVLGDTQYARAFETFGREAEDMSDPLQQIGEQLIQSVSEQFRTEGGHSRARWKSLNPTYAAWKEQQVGPEPILVFHGTMRAFMTSRSALHVSPRRLVYEPSDPEGIAAIHQAGEGSMPKRKMVDLPESDRRGWDRIFAEWLNSMRRGRLAGLA